MTKKSDDEKEKYFIRSIKLNWENIKYFE